MRLEVLLLSSGSRHYYIPGYVNYDIQAGRGTS